jgi:hypothetical protein
MATIRYIKHGPSKRMTEIMDVPLADCVAKLGLSMAHYQHSNDKTLGPFLNRRRGASLRGEVTIEVVPEEARGSGLDAGFYHFGRPDAGRGG